MANAKLSISVDSELVRFVERYQQKHHLGTKSEVVERALELLRGESLTEEYAAEFKEWHESRDRDLWDVTLSDGLDPDEEW